MAPIPGSGLAKGLAVTLRTMTKKSVTAQYPDAQPDLPPRTRGVIGLFEENCTVCMLCARECPDWCIYIDSHKETVPAATPGGRERSRNVLDRFAIDFSLCMYCGICIEVCPFDALFWSPEFEYAETDIHDLTHERDKLREWMWTVPAPCGPRPRSGGAEGSRHRPQDRRETRCPAAARAHRVRRRPAGPRGGSPHPSGRRLPAADRPAEAAARGRAGGTGMTLAAAATTAAQATTTAAHATTSAAESHGFLSPTGVEIAFLLVGLVTFGAAIVTVTTRQLVHAALWLVVTLGGLAVEYLLLTAEFIAWVQVLIYVGSVVVLLLFGLMLTRAPIGRSPDADSGNRWAALTVALAAAAALVWVVVDAFRTTWIDLDGPAAGSTEATGASLFQNWVLPFEALSVLLLAALVGAIVLSRKAKADAATAPESAPADGTPVYRSEKDEKKDEKEGTR